MQSIICGAGAFLAGTILAGSVAQAQFGAGCAELPGCAVPAPSCAVGELSCAPTGVPSCAPVNYEVVKQPAPKGPCLPITYEVVGQCAPAGCAEMPCVGDSCAAVPCADDACAPACAPAAPLAQSPSGPIGCVETACAPSGCTGAGCLGAGCANGKCGVCDACLGAGLGAIRLVGDTVKEKYRTAARNWYYKSFDWHRHLNHPIVSPAGQPGYGYHQTCWGRFPEQSQWCPPCYNTGFGAAGLYPPNVYPPRAGAAAGGGTITSPTIIPPAAPAIETGPSTGPAESEPSPPANGAEPGAQEEYDPPAVDPAPPAGSAEPAAALPMNSAARLYSAVR